MTGNQKRRNQKKTKEQEQNADSDDEEDQDNFSTRDSEDEVLDEEINKVNEQMNGILGDPQSSSGEDSD